MNDSKILPTVSQEKTALVTGGAGFIGSNIAHYLIGEGYTVRMVDDFSAGKWENVPEAAEVIEGDVTDRALMQAACKGVDYVFHLAARPRVQDSIDHPFETHRVNVEGTMSVLDAAARAGVKRFVLSSTSAVYGDTDVFPLHEESSALSPVSPYGIHKLTDEHLCRLWSMLYELPTVSLRYFNVYGPRCDPYGSYPLVVSLFLEKRRLGQTLTIIGAGTNTRDYVHVLDVARANVLAALSDTVGKGEVINIGSGVETSVIEIAQMVGGPIEHIAPRVEPARSVAAIKRAQELLGFTPEITLQEGIAELKKEYTVPE